LAAAGRLAPGGGCTGIDVSGSMIAAARARAEGAGARTEFLCGDAQEHPFAPAGFDRILSRFGVMFFDDPVRAFRNLRRAARDGARMRFVAWRSAALNPFMTTAERAAAPLLPGLPARRPDGPGQFAFADGRRVATLLAEAGWSDVDVRPVDVACTLAESDLHAYLTRLGPVGLALQREDERTRARVAAVVRAAFDPYVEGESVRFSAACWQVDARWA
jgi:SAM-dependent methyltransferase